MKNLRLSILALVISACAFAQGLVTIQAVPPITRADGSLANGTMSVSWQAFTTADGTPVAPGAKNVAISSGVFTTAVQLYPNVGATPPGTSYLVQYNLSGSPVFQRRWYIPASNIPIDVVVVEFPIQGLVGITAIVSPAQLTQAGASVNQPLCWNGAFWGPGSCGGGGFSLPGSNGSLLYRASSSSFGAVGLGTTTTLLHGNAAGSPTYGQVVTGDIGAGAVNLTTQVSGILPPANGGSGTSNVFTQGSVLFAGTAGITQQDNANFFWNQAQHQLGIGTSTTVAPITITDSNSNNTAIQVNGSSGANVNIVLQDGNGAGTWALSAINTGQFSVFDATHIFNPLTITAGDNVLVGGNTDGNYRFDVVNSSFGGTARFFDQTPSGQTKISITAGAGQGSANLLTVGDNSNHNIAGITNDGSIYSAKNIVSIPSLASGSGASLNGAYSNGLAFSNNKFITWSSTGNWFDTADTGLSRFSPAILEVNNGVPGQRYGSQIIAGSATFFDTTPTTGVTQLGLQGGAGQGGNSLIIGRNNGGNILFAVGSGGDVNVFDTSGNDKAQLNATGEVLTSDVSIGFTNGTSLNSSSRDAGISRISAGLVGIGNGTPGSFSGSFKASSATLTSLANSGCVQANSSGLLTGTGSPCGGEYLNATYNFTPQTPGGTLTASSPSTITLTGCPFGVAGADTNHYLYISGGTGTAEAVLITGGSCTSGATSGTVTFMPVNNHSGAWMVASATGGVQEAFQVGLATGNPFAIGIVGSMTAFGPAVLSGSNFSLIGHGAVWNTSFPAGTSYRALSFIGVGAITSTTTTTNLALNQRSLVTNRTIGVASVSGLSAGNIVQLFYDDATYHFEQYNVIESISSLNVSFVDPIVVPLLTTQSGNVTKFTTVSNLLVRDIHFDCSGASGASAVAGLFAQYVVDSRFENLRFSNCNTGGSNSAGFLAYGGHGNSFKSIHSKNSGSAGAYAVGFDRQSVASMDDVISEGDGLDPPHAFGIGFNYCYLCNASNINSNGNYSRQVKLDGTGWSRFSNINASNASNATGLAITIGSYRNQFTNVTTLLNQNGGANNGVGVWGSGQDNEYNTFVNVQSFQNSNGDVAFASTDIHNSFSNLDITQILTLQNDGANLDRYDLVANAQLGATFSCSGTATSSSTLFIAVTPPGACTLSSLGVQSITVPTNGTVRNLRVTAGTGGTGASSGVVSIGIVGNGLSGITCTIGTATTCSDTAHFFQAPAGTQLYVQFTTQGSETLANLQVSFEY